MSIPDAFLLLTLPNASLHTPSSTYTGTLNLECVTVPLPTTTSLSSPNSEVYLVLRLSAFEAPIDPARVISLALSPTTGVRTYTFDGTEDDPSDLVLTVSPPAATGTSSLDPVFAEDVQTFEGILAQYADFRRQPVESPSPDVPAVQNSDLRGHLVLVNQDSGEVVGEVEQQFTIMEDPALKEAGRENDPVVIEIPEKDEDAMQMFARVVPPEEQDWITKSATVIRCVCVFPPCLLDGADARRTLATPSRQRPTSSSRP
jgi:spartin